MSNNNLLVIPEESSEDQLIDLDKIFKNENGPDVSFTDSEKEDAANPHNKEKAKWKVDFGLF
jgi:hypothetical protein